MDLEKRGLTSSQIKTLGLIFMIIDHIGHFFGEYTPSWFRMIGRLSAPLFIFIAAEGFYYTRNREKHIRNLFIWGLITLVGNNLLERILPLDGGAVYLTNNIFLTFAVSLSIMYLLERIIKKGINFKDIILLILLFVSSLIVEGSFIFVGLTVMFYFLRDKKGLKLSLYVGVSLMLGFLELRNSNWNLGILLERQQWFMVFSVIPMYFYNGKKGKSFGKNFFYIFYPVHVWILYLLKYLLLK